MLKRRPELGPCVDDLVKAFGTLRDCFGSGGKVLVCGNGGSAADSEHIVGELMKGFERRRPLCAADKAKLPPALADSLQNGLPAVPLTGFLSLATAFANDVKAELVFAQLVWTLGRPGDVLVGLSTSGNAANMIHAFAAARGRGMKAIAFTGASGGECAPIVDVCVRAPSSRTCEVQECHLPLYHCLCLMLEDEFFPT
jgi:D-sedoheptulose 7-phosphate isomerase